MLQYIGGDDQVKVGSEGKVLDVRNRNANAIITGIRAEVGPGDVDPEQLRGLGSPHPFEQHPLTDTDFEYPLAANLTEVGEEALSLVLKIGGRLDRGREVIGGDRAVRR